MNVSPTLSNPAYCNSFTQALTALPLLSNFPSSTFGRAIPPPIDPGVFRSVTSIRRLIDEAAELSVRATSGLSATALGSLRGVSSGGGNGHWAAAQSLGLNPMADNPGGRNVTMSPMRVHRLRALAVQKLAQAYKADEIASSVMVMQGGSVFDNVAEKVLKVGERSRVAPRMSLETEDNAIRPQRPRCEICPFFPRKDPFPVRPDHTRPFLPHLYLARHRQLAEFTTTQVLDDLIAAHPQRLEFYRTRGFVHCFRDEYQQAIKDFTFALKEARAVRKVRLAHKINGSQAESRSKGGKKKKGSNKSNGQAPPSGTSVAENTVEGQDGEAHLIHPSISPDAPEPIEPQLLFLRGAAYLQQAVFLIENTILSLENIRKVPSVDGAELRLCYIENGKYGGVEIGHPDGPLGKRDGEKVLAYRRAFADESFREHIAILVKRSMRDHEKFLSHFDTFERTDDQVHDDIATRAERAFALSESIRPGNHASAASAQELPAMFTTYHPLLVESHFSVLLCQLMLGDFPTLLSTFARTALLIDGLEGYPVFLPPRSMAQAEFIETLERLAGGWRNGIQPHSLSHSHHRAHPKSRALQIQALPSPPISVRDTTTTPTPSPTESDVPVPSTSSILSPASLGPASAQGSSSNSAGCCIVYPITPSTSTGTIPSSGRETPSSHSSRVDLFVALDCIRILLAPVAKRQRERAEKATAVSKSGSDGTKKNPLTINIPLHGPRVEIILAWLGAVHLVELDSVT